jgi:hypothetical protein
MSVNGKERRAERIYVGLWKKDGVMRQIGKIFVGVA